MIKLKELRENHNLTQQQVAEAINKSMQAYSHYELGRREPDIETLKKLSDLYNVSVDYLLGRDEHAASTNKDTPITPDQEAIELAHQIKSLPPDVRDNIEQQIKLWASQDKK